MRCRICGLESRTTDICEWCKKPLEQPQPPQQTLAMPQPTQPMAPPPQGMAQPTMGMYPQSPGMPQQTVGMAPVAQAPAAGGGAVRRVALTGEVIEEAPQALFVRRVE